MAPSQLKQLKASLREIGVVGPQQSKKHKQKEKENNAKCGTVSESRLQRKTALQELRERFNPFEVRAPARAAKFDITSNLLALGRLRSKPGMTKSFGEQRRKETLLKEIRDKNKFGGVLDRRFGESDPAMTPEERAAERFARESQKKFKTESLFNLEDEEEFQLTHLGQSLPFKQDAVSDYLQEDDLHVSDEDRSFSRDEHVRKRRRISVKDDIESEEDQPEQKRSKSDIMKELITKSKFHKYERQKAKEDDDNLREELDKGLSDIFEMMRGTKQPNEPPRWGDHTESMNLNSRALLRGKGKDMVDREYDQRLKHMAFDRRSKPADRSKTGEEKAEEETERLKQLEKERLRRMYGERDDESDEGNVAEGHSDDEFEPGDAKTFGLRGPNIGPQPGVEDEDDFIIDEDLVGTNSEAELSFSDIDASDLPSNKSDEDVDEFIDGLNIALNANNITIPVVYNGRQPIGSANSCLGFTFPCPESHEEFLQIVKEVPHINLPTVVQRIRALHHPRLNSDNKSKLGMFSRILIQHVDYLANQRDHPPFTMLENLLRHIHSLAKSYPETVASAFRTHLREMAENRALKFLPGDLIILTGVTTIFPTSDHFHAVATPSILLLGRYLGQSAIHSLTDLARGAYVGSLCLEHQRLSKRYIPEFMSYVLNALRALAPDMSSAAPGFFPCRAPSVSVQLRGCMRIADVEKAQFWDILAEPSSEEDEEILKLTLLHTFVSLLDSAIDLWTSKSAFYEIFDQAYQVLNHASATCTDKVPASISDQMQRALDKLQVLLPQARLSRRSLLLHNHRPLAIKTAIPKFEESFNPSRYYDRDQARLELSKLKAEHKRERKGALRELRKDANFIARESLREKREADAEYDRKYRRLIAEIQGSEGKEAKAYGREKKARQRKH